jgi:pimeloyl-ACP methyl ester carboxylesterase
MRLTALARYFRRRLLPSFGMPHIGRSGKSPTSTTEPSGISSRRCDPEFPKGEPVIRASFVDVDGIRTRYLHEGSGNRNIVLLLHGFGFSADAWLRVIDPLASDYSVVAPDLLGHGFTERVDLGSAPALLTMTKHVAKFMDKIGIDRCFVVGSSLGSFLGGLLYFERQKQVERLVIGALHHPVSNTGSLDPVSLRAVMANGTKAMTDASWQACINRIGNICFDRNCPASELAFTQTTIYAQDDRLTAYRELGENFIKHVDNDKVRIYPERIKIPTLVSFRPGGHSCERGIVDHSL